MRGKLTKSLELWEAVQEGPVIKAGRKKMENCYRSLKLDGYNIENFTFNGKEIFYKTGDELEAYKTFMKLFPDIKNSDKYRNFSGLLCGHIKVDVTKGHVKHIV